MLKIRQLKAQQDAEKKAAAESGTPAQPKQSPGQLRIQKGATSDPQQSHSGATQRRQHRLPFV
eukprot:COSAG06_NODE_2196_length_7375_cov_4.349643_6_plen_63_part_00